MRHLRTPRTHALATASLAAAALTFLAAPHVMAQTTPPHFRVDANGNNISDVYEAQYPGLGAAGADDDGDGQTNLQEGTSGTNPRNGGDKLDFGSVSTTPTQVNVSFGTKAGKLYRVQASGNLAGAWANEGSPLLGTGGTMNASCPVSTTRMFLRLQVEDTDSDGDGATDWEEMSVGTNPMLADSDDDGLSDYDLIAQRLGLGNRVTVVTTQPTGSEAGSRPVSFRLTRAGNLNPVTVGYSLTGTATPLADYAQAAFGTVTFALGATSVDLNIVPLSDVTTESSETVILTVNAGAGYTVGTPDSASGTILDDGRGLTGQYFETQESTYPVPPATNANFDPAQLELTRIDPVIDFTWGNGPPAPTIDTNDWSIRWTGQVLAPTTGSYTFHCKFDRGMALYVNGVSVLSSGTHWSYTQPTPDTVAAPEVASAAVSLVGGQKYSIQLDHRESTTTPTRAEVHLYWTPPGGTKELIPSGNLYPNTTLPAITSPLFAVGIVGAPFTYQTTASPAATNFAADGLPAGLTINPTTGLISGTPTAGAGLSYATLMASNSGGSTSMPLSILLISTGGTINRETWTGLTGTGVLSVPVHTAATTTSSLTTLEAPADSGDNFGDRLRGYITAPTTGLFTFYVSSDENAEVWVSSREEPANKLKRSFLTNATTVTPGQWETVSTQKSLPMRMKAGRRYYFEAIRREQSGSDHLQIGWVRPGISTPEIVPGWALSPYTAPAAGAASGFLYAAVLTPQSGASTLGTGSALLRVNASKTEADMTVTWGNLTGPVLSSHIHDSRSSPGPVGAYLFDVDDADPDRLLPGGDGLDPTEVYHWDIIATGQHTYADVIAALEGGTAYLNLHTEAYANGEIKGFFQPVIGSQFFVPPASPPPAELTLPGDAAARKSEIVRFLQQATFGARHEPDGAAPFAPDTIESVEQLGYAGWIDAQLALSRGTDPETLVTQTLPTRTVFAWTAPTAASRSLGINNPATGYNGSGPLGQFIKSWYDKWPLVSYSNVGAPLESSDEIWRAWWRTSITAQDQLRHRVAFALSQIFVTSEDGELDEVARGVSHYYDLLYYHGLGNFRSLLEKVTLSPIMGRYLDMLNNKKPNPATGYIPNENYAREIMQLFSVGLRRLHPDGTLVLDSSGLPVTTYEQPNVVGLAHVFTGWVQPGNGSNYITPMITSASNHDIGEKLLLDEAVIAATASATDASCNAELGAALDLIYHHPNTGPFICRELIQRMVTANPSPGYIYRVARVFNDNGSGVRGDMAAVVKTLLLDPEARNQSPRYQPGFGHLKEPVVRTTQLLRAFNGFSYAEANYGTTNVLATVLISPNSNIDLAQPLPGADYVGSSSGSSALFAGDLIRLNGQTLTAENGYYTFNGAGQPLTPAATGTAVTTFAVNINIATGPPTVHVPLIEGISVGMNNLLLLRAQTNPAENGVYVVTALNAPITRWSGADTAAELSNAVIRAGVYRDPSTLAYSSNRTFKVDGVIATLGTSPVNLIDGSSTNSGIQMWNMGTTGGTALSQTPMRAPTVFNFYEPDYIFLGESGTAGLYSPEFQITSETTVINVSNWLYDLTRRNSGVTAAQTYGQGFSYGGTIGKDIKLDVSVQEALGNDVGTMVDNVASLILPGQMTPRLRTLVTNYIAGMPITGTTLLLPAGSTWKYYTDAAGLGASNIVEGHASWSTANWKHNDFNDTAWSSGAAPLGYKTGNTGITTVIPFGADAQNKWVSSYYRAEFNVASAAAVPSLTLRIKRDDAAIVYLNGKEAYRTNFTAGLVVTGATLASASGDDGAAFVTQTLPTTFLRDGRNVVAVEVHQFRVDSSDVVLDLELNHPATTSADRINRIGEALSILTLTPEFSIQK